ncbi:MAG: hypothetical protein ACREEP_12945 [Dongiaceae bacterium]
MDRLRQYGLPIAFIVCFLAVGVPYWSIPYNEVNLPDSLLAAGMVVVVVAALALRVRAIAPIWKVTAIVGASAPAAVLARVTVDVANDPTSHNLWPLEFIIALLMGLVAALAGALTGSLVAKLFARRIGS